MNFRFEYADKMQLEIILPYLFEILHANMTLIAPTGNTYDEDYKLWFSNVYPAMQKAPRQIILMYSDDSIIGYFQYYVNLGTFMMEEIQIKKVFHGTGIFSAFFSWLVRQIPSDTENVEAYAHKRNIRSQRILEHLGLTQIGENKNGNSYRYKGDYMNLLNKYMIANI